MAVNGLWNAVYDRHLVWTGLFLEALGEPGDGMPDMVPSGKALFIEAEALTDAPEQWPSANLTVVLRDLDGTTAFPALQGHGAHFALADLDQPAAESCKTRLFNAAALPNEKTLQTLSRNELQLLAYNLSSLADYRRCLSRGFSLFCFGKLDLPGSGGIPQDTSRLQLMRLLSLVAKDAETAEMEEVFKLEPKLAFELLRLVNSTSFAMRTEITSFAQAIMVLGRRQLQRWLQLLLFAHRKDGDDGPNILMQRAAERGRLLELLAVVGNQTASREQAFMVGVFSLLDVLMAAPLAGLLKTVALPNPVETALLNHQGRLGALLELVCAAEASDRPEVLCCLDELGIAPDEFSRIQLEALTWALQVARLS